MLRALLHRPVSVVIATLSLVALGGFSLLRLPVSLLPTLERPRLTVELHDQDRGREDWLRQVIEPLERRLLAVEDVIEVRGLIDDGHARLVLETEWETEVDHLRIDVERRLAEIAVLGLERVDVRIDAGDPRAILAVAVTGGGSNHGRTTFVDKVLIPELGRLSGAGELRRVGGALRRPVVRPLAAALAARNLTAGDVIERLTQVGDSQPLGLVRDGANVRALQWREGVDSLEDLGRLRLGDARGTILGDVAQITLEDIPSAGVARHHGQPAVLVEIHRAPGANAVLLAREVRQRIAELQERTPGGLQITIVRDGSREVVDALTQLALAGVIGLALGTLVLRFMLGSFRPTLALAIVVPASIVTAFGAFYFWNISLDAVSLAGLALAVGLLIDNSIVVLEAIGSARERGEEEPEIHGTEQIALALVASLLTTAVVFLPLIYLRGLARAFFGVQAFAIVSSLAISLVFSLTLTPLLARAKASERNRQNPGRSPGLSFYTRLLKRSLDRPFWALALTVLILGLGAAALPQLPRQLIPDGPARWLDLELDLPAGLSRDAVADRLTRLEQRLHGNGSPELTVFDPEASDVDAEATSALRANMEWRFDDRASLHATLSALQRAALGQSDARFTLKPRRGAVADALRENRGLELALSAATPERAAQLATRLSQDLEERFGWRSQPIRSGGPRRPGLTLRLDEARLVALGQAGLAIDRRTLGTQIRQGLGGIDAGRLDMVDSEGDIRIENTLPAALETLPIRAAGLSTEVLPLAAVARVTPAERPQRLERRNGRPSVDLRLDAAAGEATHLQSWLASWPRAADEDLQLYGRAEEILRSFGQLRLALILALLLVFLTMAAIYESLTLPLVVMITVPVATAGALGALLLGGQSLNVMSFLGLILLTGIVVNNAIVLIHRIEQHRRDLPLRQAIELGARERYRPILMTTLTTLLGLLPLALLGGEGTELRRALAVAASGGLLTALFATLYAVPTLYQWLARPRGTS